MIVKKREMQKSTFQRINIQLVKSGKEWKKEIKANNEWENEENENEYREIRKKITR